MTLIGRDGAPLEVQLPKSSARQYYRPELDVVRFLAFLFVFLSHTLPRTPTPRASAFFGRFAPLFYAVANAGRFGVCLFFTLSAFLICELLLREREVSGTVAVKQFYIRRILRIWPLYYFGLALGAVLACMPGGSRDELVGLCWFAIFMGAWRSAIHGWLNNPMFVLWSVSIEEQFYLFAPWAVKCFRRGVLYIFGAAIVLAANVWLYRLCMERASDDRIWADSVVQFQCFAAGIFLCLILRGRAPQVGLWMRCLLLAGSWLCWLMACGGPDSAYAIAYDTSTRWTILSRVFLISAGSILMLLAFLGVSWRLLPRWAVYLGRISFGLYVFHGVARDLSFYLLPKAGDFHGSMFILRFFTALGLTVAMATVSYRYIETPFLKLKKRHTIIESQPVLEHLAGIGVPEAVSRA